GGVTRALINRLKRGGRKGGGRNCEYSRPEGSPDRIVRPGLLDDTLDTIKEGLSAELDDEVEEE
ncbi:unnamed protein product, partial [marine sediment metagenome]